MAKTNFLGMKPVSKAKYLDKTRYPNVVNPIEKEFVQNYKGVLDVMVQTLSLKIKSYEQENNLSAYQREL